MAGSKHLTLGNIFKLLKFGKNANYVNCIFPDLYGEWVKQYKQSTGKKDKKVEIEGATMSRIMNCSDNATIYYNANIKHLGIRDLEVEKLASFCAAIENNYKTNIKNGTIKREQIEKLQSDFEEDLKEYKLLDNLEIIKLLDIIRCDNTSEQTDKDTLFLLSIYTILALTVGSWEQTAKLLVQICNNRGFSLVSDLDRALFEIEDGNLFEGEKSLDEISKRDDPKGDAAFELAKIVKARYLRSKNNEKKNSFREEYKSYLEIACNKENCEAIVERARAYYTGDILEKNYSLCTNDCIYLINNEKTLKLHVVGEAYWLLYNLVNQGVSAAKDYSKAKNLYPSDFLLEKACECSWAEALLKKAEIKERDVFSAEKALSKQPISFDGYIFLNDEKDNAIAEMIIQTAPTSAKISAFTINDAIEAIETGSAIQFFFIKTSETNNLKDMLLLIQLLKEHASYSTDNLFAYILGEEEKLSPIIDTAQEQLGERVIPVLIIDQDKRDAQRLLYEHPLFYPIREYKTQKSKKRTLHFVILGETNCSMWLVREAFWMMTSRDDNITFRITIVSKNASSLIERLQFECPGMDEYIKTNTAKDGKKTVLIDAANISLDSTELIRKIRELYGKKREDCYFAIDSDDELSSMNLAIKVRETLIREWLSLGAPARLNEPPVIAFRCSNPNVASLSRDLIVLNESLGSSWYNHYRLIPYGSLSEQYAWEAITNDIIEKMSYCNQLQYYDIGDLDEDIALRSETIKHAKKYYYRRNYNHDSSTALALSIPYRLFQSQFITTEIDNIKCTQGIIPENWNILDRNTYREAKTLLRFSEIYDSFVEKADVVITIHGDTINNNEANELEFIAEWEHERWNRYMISRGWVTASKSQVALYRQHGNVRQQLYIGRMHPCIIQYKKLKQLEDELNFDGNTKLDFTSNDIKNVKATGDIISMKLMQIEREFISEVQNNKERL